MKIEVPPNHSLVPQVLTKKSGLYFESHLQVLCDNTVLDNLYSLAQSLNCHCSKNAFKEYENDSVVMVTYRGYDGTARQFELSVDIIRNQLIMQGFDVEKAIIEFCVYDSNINHDDLWLGVDTTH